MGKSLYSIGNYTDEFQLSAIANDASRARDSPKRSLLTLRDTAPTAHYIRPFCAFIIFHSRMCTFRDSVRCAHTIAANEANRKQRRDHNLIP